MTFTREEVNLVLLTQSFTAVLWGNTQLVLPRPLAQVAQHVQYQADEEGIGAEKVEEDLREAVVRMAMCRGVNFEEAHGALGSGPGASGPGAIWAEAFLHAAEDRRGNKTLYYGLLKVLDELLTHFGV